MLTKPDMRLEPIRKGIPSRYVSVVLSSMFIAFSPASTAAVLLNTCFIRDNA